MKHIINIVVFVFFMTVSLYSQLNRLSPSELKDYSIFGREVTAYGNWAAVSAPGFNVGNHIKTGAVFMYHFEDNAWKFQSTVYPNEITDLMYFGHSVLIKNDWLFVSAPGDFINGPFSGAVYCYKLSGSTWNFIQKIYSDDGDGSHYFGQSMSISGNYLGIGAYLATGKTEKSGAVYLFKYDKTKWVFSQKLYDDNGMANQLFGFDIDFQNNGALAIGAPKANGVSENSGAVYMYNKTTSGYVFTAKIFDTEGKTGDQFGHSVSIEDNILVVGSHLSVQRSINHGAVFIYTKSNDVWKFNKKIINETKNKDYFGYDVSFNGKYLLIGAPNYTIEEVGNVGSAFLYKLNGVVWEELKDIQLAGEMPTDFFASSVSIDSVNLLIGARMNGANDKGAAYIEKLSRITGDSLLIPEAFGLDQNFPNPFNPVTVIQYYIKDPVEVKVEVFDILGRNVTTLVNELKEPGKYQVRFDGFGCASGVYFYRIKAGTFTDTKKMLLIK